MSPSRGNTLSDESVEALREDHRRYNQLLSSIGPMKRRVFEGDTLTLMVVTETQDLSGYGLGQFENVAVDGVYQPFESINAVNAFRAKIFSPGTTRISQLSKLNDIWVDPSLISTALITGQLFLMTSAAVSQQSVSVAIKGKTNGTLAGGVVTPAIGNRWYGLYRTSPFGNVDLAFAQAVANDKAQLTANYCRIAATNQLGITLTDMQGVRVDYMARGATSFQGSSSAGGSPGQWAITDYSCSMGTGILTG